MTPRERLLAMIVLALLVVGVGGVGGYMFILSPLQEKERAAQGLQGEVDELDSKLLAMRKAAPQVAAVKRASLPPDPSDSKDPNRVPTFNFARAEYKRLIERLLLRAGITDGKPGVDKVAIHRPPITPELSAKKPAYYTLTFQIEINKANLWQVVDFLYGYYQVDLLHQITDITITRENKASETRGGLKVTITSEAIALDGVEPRSSLIPMTSSIAAVAGELGLQAIAARPELVHRLSRSTALASRTRDYSFIALGDMFYGVVPTYVPPKPVPFEIARIDNVTMTRDEKPKEVVVHLKGDGAGEAKVTAVASGSLLKEGRLTVDHDAGTITIPAVKATVEDDATSVVEVVAVSGDGTTKKTSFTVAVEKLPKPPPGPDISSAIRLVIVSTTSEGTAEAWIKDNANPFRYVVTATPKGIEISKWWQVTGKTWKKDRDYSQPPGILEVKDDDSSTKRLFKIIAFEHNALIVCDITPPEPAPSESKKPAIPGVPVRPPGGASKQTPAEAITAVAAAITAGIPKPAYYRWTAGKSLKELLDPSPKNPNRLKPDEVSEILRRVAADGPAGPVVASGD
jgi:hypothetical protein